MSRLWQCWAGALAACLLVVATGGAPASATPRSTGTPTAVVSAGPASGSRPPAGGATGGEMTAWTSPMDLLLQPFPRVSADNTTVREIATVAVGGTSVRLRLSNGWGPVPLTVGAVSVAERDGTTGAGAVPGTLVPVTFGGSRSVTVPAGQDVTSDSAALTVTAGETLVVSIWVPGVAPVSVHDCCQGRVVSYYTRNGGGDRTASLSGAVFTGKDWWDRWLSAVEVGGSQAQGTVVALGDSITDGFGYQTAGFSWVGALNQRIAQLPADQQVAVVNEGIAGNTLTAFPPGHNSSGEDNTFAASGGGTPGLERLGRDALDLPGVRAVVVLLGTNDIWFGYTDNDPPYGSAASIIGGMKQLIAEVHAAGLKVYGVPLLPRLTSPPCTQPGNCRAEEWGPAEQATLEAVDAWALAPGSGFDGVINLAAVMGDVYAGQCQPWAPYPPYFNADNLHPNVAGQTAMANAIPTTLFGLPEAPQLPPVVVAVPTAGCGAALTAESVIAAASSPSGTGAGASTTTPPTSTSAVAGAPTSSTTPTTTPTTSATSPTTTPAGSSPPGSQTTAPLASGQGRRGAVGGANGGAGGTNTLLLAALAVVAVLLGAVAWRLHSRGGLRGG